MAGAAHSPQQFLHTRICSTFYLPSRRPTADKGPVLKLVVCAMLSCKSTVVQTTTAARTRRSESSQPPDSPPLLLCCAAPVVTTVRLRRDARFSCLLANNFTGQKGRPLARGRAAVGGAAAALLAAGHRRPATARCAHHYYYYHPAQLVCLTLD